mmetsp:Transcript_10173/g.19921  ORF Transcript_10173/g.19921 Transcript_10173/m.19921 type:complete len:136 (-) Transcript_10173:164-571(-)
MTMEQGQQRHEEMKTDHQAKSDLGLTQNADLRSHDEADKQRQESRTSSNNTVYEGDNSTFSNGNSNLNIINDDYSNEAKADIPFDVLENDPQNVIDAAAGPSAGQQHAFQAALKASFSSSQEHNSDESKLQADTP